MNVSHDPPELVPASELIACIDRIATWLAELPEKLTAKLPEEHRERVRLRLMTEIERIQIEMLDTAIAVIESAGK